MEATKIAKGFFKKWFGTQHVYETDWEFKALVRILNKKDKQTKKAIEQRDEARAIAKRLYKEADMGYRLIHEAGEIIDKF